MSFNQQTASFSPVLIPILFVGFIVIAAIFGFVQTRKRREGLFELAQRLNLNFDGGRNEGISNQFSFFKQFNEGRNRYATNILSGNYRQSEILAFDYHYTIGSGKSQQDVNLSFFILTVPGGCFPHITIRREGFFDRVAEAFGAQDIKFESAEFSKAFCVRSADKKFAYDVCNSKMMEYLLANRDLSIEMENDIIALVFGKRIAVEQFEPDLNRLTQIRSLLPDYLFTQNT